MTDEPQKLTGISKDISAENREKLKQLFPSVFTETRNDKGELAESIDLEKLKAELGTFTEAFENRRERYGMDWPGKREVLKLIQTQSAATLKPCREESVNFDTTENLFIEGDNLEVLKLLQKSYYNKVKMIYIDPPYNTGKELIYPDNYSESLDTYLEYAGLIDSTGKRFSTNMTTEGRFHTKWLNMMYPRLYLARNLLNENGVIFISIGEEEIANLTNLCNEIFGEDNKVSILSRVSKTASNMGTFFAPSIDFILCYAKNINFLDEFKGEVDKSLYTKTETEGSRKGELYRDDVALFQSSLTLERSRNARYFIQCPDGSKCIPPVNKRWRVVESTVIDMLQKNMIVFKETKSSPLLDQDGNKSKWNLYTKSYLVDREAVGTLPRNYLDEFINRKGADLLKTYGIDFDFAKPVDLITHLIKIINGNINDIFLDFFAGSATTAHAVLDLNKQDNGSRKFIMVQLPEKCDEDSESFKAGFKTIADIGKERIRRVIKRLNDEDNGKLNLDEKPKQDRGFKVLKLDKTNFKQWAALSAETPQDEILKQLELSLDKVDPKASDEDMLYEVIIKSGLSPTQPIAKLELAGITVYSLEDGLFMVCLAPEVNQAFFDKVAELKPTRFICLDSAFKGNDTLKANASLTFKARNTGEDNATQTVFEVI